MLTDAAGAVVAQYVYDAWGNILAQPGSHQISAASPIQANGMDPGYGKSTVIVTTPYLYGGQAGVRADLVMSNGAVLYDMRVREYHSALARFNQRDPLGQRAAQRPSGMIAGGPLLYCDEHFLLLKQNPASPGRSPLLSGMAGSDQVLLQPISTRSIPMRSAGA
ncbi:MAG: hypothetical protein P4L33_10750 [Capsulimonadaceae bacterium]|nr:hypothetical protein [Capsulimonadaceae bacterium]